MQSLLRARVISRLWPTVVSRPQIRCFRVNLILDTNAAGSSTPSASTSKQPSNAQTPKSAATESATDEGLPLSFLSRPLGVAEVPSATPKSWSKAREELLDRDKHLEKRRHIVKEVTRGYFHDFHKLKHHGGKMWIAPRVLIREDKALYFPDVTGVTLSDRSATHTTTACTGRITLLSVLSTKISELHAQSFIEAALKQHKGAPKFQYMQVSEELQPTYILSHQNMEFLRVPLVSDARPGMENKHIGYTYLIDENLKVRWAGCGFARPEEAEALANCTRILLERLDSSPAPSQKPKTPAE
ncbi:Mitochondrial ATPase complex subunit atp10 [Ceratobasidium sp. 392]|nr:Mitochondrial ATPase complex subunit atp10 [Ceratobasidium sp. 392]